jgi:hypothetical protein
MRCRSQWGLSSARCYTLLSNGTAEPFTEASLARPTVDLGLAYRISSPESTLWGAWLLWVGPE